MVRLVRTPEGVKIDLSGKLTGRGAYLHALQSCWHKALKGPLANALKVALSEGDRDALMEYMQTLPEKEDEAEELKE
jgi:predicted RNA-binding protein YlxR (DUF448 family)